MCLYAQIQKKEEKKTCSSFFAFDFSERLGHPSQMATLKEVTEDQAALYDRQIRLWGLDAQQRYMVPQEEEEEENRYKISSSFSTPRTHRIQNAKILVVHVGGISTEALKNVVLAGVGSVTILDPGKVTEEALATQFLFSPDSIGENVRPPSNLSLPPHPTPPKNLLPSLLPSTSS